MIKRKDIYLIIGILFLGILGVWWINRRGETGGQAQVTVDGQVYGTYALAMEQTVVITTQWGENTLRISGGQAQMTEADCPDKYCVEHIPVNQTGETIICLPHRVVVEIQGGTPPEVDAS